MRYGFACGGTTTFATPASLSFYPPRQIYSALLLPFLLLCTGVRVLRMVKVHCKKVRMRDGLFAGLDEVARSTSGFSGAELANVVNEAAMLAARCGRRLRRQG